VDWDKKKIEVKGGVDAPSSGQLFRWLDNKKQNDWPLSKLWYW
jgi:hypothetical protein